MNKHYSQPLSSKRRFLRSMLNHLLDAQAVILATLGSGIIGYRSFRGMAWIGALLNASMILGGMRLFNQLPANAGKFIASFYPLFSGIAPLAVTGLIFAPIAHRVVPDLTRMILMKPPLEAPVNVTALKRYCCSCSGLVAGLPHTASLTENTAQFLPSNARVL